MEARNREEYVAAWQRHIDEMVSLAFAANMPHTDWLKLKEKLYQLVEIATAQVYDRLTMKKEDA